MMYHPLVVRDLAAVYVRDLTRADRPQLSAFARRMPGSGQGSGASYDPGQAGRAERTPNQPDAAALPVEDTLIRVRTAGGTFAGDPGARQARSRPALLVVAGR